MGSIKKSGRILLHIGFFLIALALVARAQDPTISTLISYSSPDGAILSPDYTVKVNDSVEPVYHYQASFCSFDSSTSVDIVVTVPTVQAIQNVVVRPLRLGIKPVVSGNTIKFSLKEQRNVELEVNGNTTNPLFIFDNPIEANRPDHATGSIVYYGPGLHDVGTVEIPSDSTVYIAGGAIVTGTFHADGASNIKILGRGILLQTGRLIIRNCEDVLLQGFITANNETWTIVPQQCRNLTIDNVKVFPEPDWGHDGMDICGCQKVTIKNCCIWCKDDCIVLKSFGGDIEDHEIFDNMLWSTGQNTLEIGFELNCDDVTRIHYHDIDILHYTGGWAAMGIHSLGWGRSTARARISHILYENINVEDCTGRLFDIICVPNFGNWGNVEDITYRNVKVVGGPNPPSYIQIGADYNNHIGFSDPGDTFNDGHTVKNITFENLEILGKKILKPTDAVFHIGNNTQNIQFKAGSDNSLSFPPN